MHCHQPKKHDNLLMYQLIPYAGRNMAEIDSMRWFVIPEALIFQNILPGEERKTKTTKCLHM